MNMNMDICWYICMHVLCVCMWRQWRQPSLIARPWALYDSSTSKLRTQLVLLRAQLLDSILSPALLAGRRLHKGSLVRQYGEGSLGVSMGPPDDFIHF